jgi:heat shock protein HslJ
VTVSQRFTSRKLKGRDRVPGTELMVEFDGPKLIASAGCNRIVGNSRLKNGRLKFAGKPAVTQMACSDAKMEQERWYIDWLTAGVDMTITGDRLVLSGDGVKATYLRTAATGDGAGQAPIAGTDWEVVSTAAAGGDETKVPSGAATPTLRIDGDKATLFTGCNRGTARANVRDDGFIEFTAVATTRKACGGDEGDLETQVLTVLKGEVAAAFDGDGRLVLTKDGARLTLEAQ